MFEVSSAFKAKLEERTPSPPKEEIKKLKVKAKLRNDYCVNCVFYSHKTLTNGFCEKHQHGKHPLHRCRYHYSSEHHREDVRRNRHLAQDRYYTGI